MLTPFALSFLTVDSLKRQSDQKFIGEPGRPRARHSDSKGCLERRLGAGEERAGGPRPGPNVQVTAPTLVAHRG